MAQIGLAIAGRHPGFEVFSAINWFGPEPEDRDVRGVVQSDSYVSAILGPEYDTYELVLCNFVSSSGRPEAFRIMLRLPHGMTLISGENVVVAPTFVLRQVREALVGSTLLNLGSTVRFAPGTVRPAFPDDRLGAIVGAYRTEQRWGQGITMLNSNGHPQFVEASEQEIPAMLGALPLCQRLTQASTVYFGHFSPGAQPQFRFMPEELNARPKIQVFISGRDGNKGPLLLGAVPTVFNSADYGFSKLAYEEVQVTLDEELVFSTYHRGCMSLPCPNGVSVQLMAREGEVLVKFSPAPLRKTFFIVPTNGKPGNILPNDLLLTDLNSTEWKAVSPAGYIFEGENIINFERSCANTMMLAGKFRVAANKNYKIEGAMLSGDTIKVTLKELPPVHVPTPGGNAARPHAGAEAQSRTLTLTAPANWKLAKIPVVVQNNSHPNPIDFYLVLPAEFLLTQDGTKLMATVNVPAIVNHNDFQASLGVPPIADTQLLLNQEGGLTAEFEKGDRTGFLSKISDTFVYKYGAYLRGGWKVWRAVMPLILCIVLVIAGVVIGVLTADHIRHSFDQIQGWTQELITTETPDDAEVAAPEPDYMPDSAEGAPEGGKILEPEANESPAPTSK